MEIRIFDGGTGYSNGGADIDEEVNSCCYLQVSL